MPTTPLAYNTGSIISGTTHVVNLAVGSTEQPYCNNIGGVKWWMGPEESTGFIIGVPVSGGNQPTPISGVSASVGFYRSKFKTGNSFIDLTNRVFKQSFTNANSASYWLTTNGYWNTYSGSAGGNITIYTEWEVSSSLAGFLKVPSTGTYTQYTVFSGTVDYNVYPGSDVVAGGGVSPQVSTLILNGPTTVNAIGSGVQVLQTGTSKSVTLNVYRNNVLVTSETQTMGPYLTVPVYPQYTALYLNGAIDDGDVFRFAWS